MSRVLSRIRSARTPAPADLLPPTHRRADLVIELPAEANLNRGARIHLAMDTTRIHIFDQTGRRVDRITR
jgi:multiple sugar transport system ATP-binding protein